MLTMQSIWTVTSLEGCTFSFRNQQIKLLPRDQMPQYDASSVWHHSKLFSRRDKKVQLKINLSFYKSSLLQLSRASRFRYQWCWRRRRGRSFDDRTEPKDRKSFRRRSGLASYPRQNRKVRFYRVEAHPLFSVWMLFLHCIFPFSEPKLSGFIQFWNCQLDTWQVEFLINFFELLLLLKFI